MAYLYENPEEFANAVNLASEYFHIPPIIAEKDYYVTMILRKLSEGQDFIVFKGDTGGDEKAEEIYSLSSGKVGGTNDTIKTIRRQGYIYPDDNYFFLKVFDASRRIYIRSPKSHKI